MIGRIAQFWGLVRELDLRHVRADLERLPRIAVRGNPGSGRHTLARSLFGSGAGEAVYAVLPAASDDLEAFDLSILVLDGREASSFEMRQAAADLALQGPLLVVITHADETLDLNTREEVRIAATTAAGATGIWIDARDHSAVRSLIGPAVVDSLPSLTLALGRWVPALRSEVATRIIHDASRVNAEFALMSNLPAVIPFVGGVVGDVADLFVLTKNQAMLVFKLAGVYGRDLGNVPILAAEILPVVGGAFLWRTLARSAVGLLPPMISALPKTVVAFSGTFVVGEMARFYYERGTRPPDAAIAGFQTEAFRFYGRVAGRIGRALPGPLRHRAKGDA